MLKWFDEKKIHEVHTTETKRKMGEHSSSTISSRNQEQSIPTTTIKKFKTINEDDIVFCDNDDYDGN